MKIIAIILRLVNWLVAILGGIVGFLWFADVINLKTISLYADQANTNPGLRVILIILAVYLVLFNLLYFIGSLFPSKYVSHIKLDLPGGDFSITLSAIENSLRRVVRKLPEVHDAHTNLYKDRKSETKPIIIRTVYSTWEGSDTREVTERIRTVIQQRLQEIVQLKEPPVFQIILSSFVEGRPKTTGFKKEKELPFIRLEDIDEIATKKTEPEKKEEEPPEEEPSDILSNLVEDKSKKTEPEKEEEGPPEEESSAEPKTFSEPEYPIDKGEKPTE